MKTVYFIRYAVGDKEEEGVIDPPVTLPPPSNSPNKSLAKLCQWRRFVGAIIARAIFTSQAETERDRDKQRQRVKERGSRRIRRQFPL